MTTTIASLTPKMRPLSCWKTLLRHTRRQNASIRCLTTYHRIQPKNVPLPPSRASPNSKTKALPPMISYPPPPSAASLSSHPIDALTASQIATLDPNGSRSNLFSRTNPEAAKVGDILLVRQRSGDTFAGICMNIRRRGIDTGILLRNKLTNVSVEMWFKIYSPNVEGIEVVQRAERRARRARLTYLRKKEHDVGSVQGIVGTYLRNRAVLGAGGKVKSAGTGKKGKGKKR